MSVHLRLLDKADKEILKLPRVVKGAIYEFQHKFRRDPSSPGLHLKQLKGSRLHSARVTADYRALLLRVSGSEYLLVAVKHRGESYENLDRYVYQVNPVSGGIEFADIASIEDSVFGRAVEVEFPAGHASVSPAAPEPDRSLQISTPPAVAAPATAPDAPAPLFAAYTQAQLLDLGVAEPLLPTIAKITTEDELLALADYLPQLTAEVLLALQDGHTPEEVLEQVTAPVRADEPVDPDDYTRALDRPATQVTTDDAALQAVLEGDFARWQVFLHPTQRKVVERNYGGPARVSGGPGTGKTIVALHRVKHLVDRLPPGDGPDVLLTTFNKNLAADLRKRLLELGGEQTVRRVDIVNIDKLAAQVVTEAEPRIRRHWMDDTRVVQMWRAILAETGESRWDAEFLNEEWSQVVLGQAITSRAEYFRVRRVGRGRQLDRAQRADIWQLIEQFTKRLDEANVRTFRQVAAQAARIERDRADREGGNRRYRHIVVDEAQDLSAAHWMLLRAMVAGGRNDMFLAADTHQRIYDNYVSLSSLGIAIRGRSTRLTLSYRTTREILRDATRLLGDEDWDDMDGGADSLAGYRSVLRGPRPVFRAAQTWQAELDGIAAQVRQWSDDAQPSIAVAVPERHQVTDVVHYLAGMDIPAAEIGPDGPRRYDAVHVGTLHRFKGLEYQRVILAGICDGAIPRWQLAEVRTRDPLRYRREQQRARSLLFVAATRARDSLVISWHGMPSPFLPAAPRP